jgi:hypothetical protein
MIGMPYDAIATFLVFLIGVPALVIQSLDAEIRRAVLKKPRALVVGVGWPIAAAMLIVAMGSLLLAAEPASAPVAVSTAPEPQAQIAAAVERLAAQADEDQRVQSQRERVWVAVTFLLTFLSVVAAVYIPNRFGQRDRVITDLKRVAQKSQQRARLNDDALTTLIELGEQSQPGEDKQLVLDALGELALGVRQDTAYRGDSLETLIEGLKNIFASDSPPGNPDNFRAAIGILQEIIMTPAARAESRSTDLFYAIRALSEVSRSALAHLQHPTEIERTLMVCAGWLQSATRLHPAATTEVSQALFEIGVAAMEKKQVLAATAALDALFSLVEANQPAKGELVADALGLASHFWTEGEAARGYVQVRLVAAKGELAQTWRQALGTAHKHCAQTMQFGTADKLAEMMADIPKR